MGEDKDKKEPGTNLDAHLSPHDTLTPIIEQDFLELESELRQLQKRATERSIQLQIEDAIALCHVALKEMKKNTPRGKIQGYLFNIQSELKSIREKMPVLMQEQIIHGLENTKEPGTNLDAHLSPYDTLTSIMELDFIELEAELRRLYKRATERSIQLQIEAAIEECHMALGKMKENTPRSKIQIHLISIQFELKDIREKMQAIHAPPNSDDLEFSSQSSKSNSNHEYDSEDGEQEKQEDENEDQDDAIEEEADETPPGQKQFFVGTPSEGAFLRVIIPPEIYKKGELTEDPLSPIAPTPINTPYTLYAEITQTNEGMHSSAVYCSAKMKTTDERREMAKACIAGTLQTNDDEMDTLNISKGHPENMKAAFKVCIMSHIQFDIPESGTNEDALYQEARKELDSLSHEEQYQYKISNVTAKDNAQNNIKVCIQRTNENANLKTLQDDFESRVHRKTMPATQQNRNDFHS